MDRVTRAFGLTFALIFFSIASAAGSANAFAGQTTRVSLNSAGEPLIGNGLRAQGLSADGHYVVFSSAATNLGYSGQQVYRRACATADCTLGTTDLVSVRPDGVASGGFSPSISSDGRYVAFVSLSPDLIAGKADTNATTDVFLRDMRNPSSTRLVSANASGDYVGGGGTLSNNASDAHAISDDGNFVAFASSSSDLVSTPNNSTTQIYVKNMTTGEVILASTHDGAAGNGASSLPVLSGNGRFVAFQSVSTNLTTPALATASSQIYVRDLTSQTTSLESLTWDGLTLLGGQNSTPTLSRNGRYLAFESTLQLDNRSDHDVNTWDVYLRDRGDATTAPTTAHVSHSDTPTFFPTVDSRSPSISADGNLVAFQSLDMGLVPGDLNGTVDVFLYDRATTALLLVSRNDDGVQANLPSTGPSLSEHGSLVLFASAATNLVTTPFTSNAQLYLRNLVTNQAPVLAPFGKDIPLLEAQPLHLTWEFSDNDASTAWTATVDWGDGAGKQPLALAANKTFFLDHLYAPGAYDLTVVVTDDAFATGSLVIHVVVANVAPLVNMPSALDLAFARTIDSNGTFVDPGSNETYSATVNYGDNTGTQPLALGPYSAPPFVAGSFVLHHTYAAAGTYSVAVTVLDSNGGSQTATMSVKVGGFSYEFFDAFTIGRNLPVKFTVHGPDGAFVLDESVRVDVVDASGAVVAGPYVFGDQPSRSVMASGDSYHVNVDTKDVAPGQYWLRVQFSSPTLTGEFRLASTDPNGATKTRTTR